VNDSLSIIVPVRNNEATLAAHIGRLLDLLPDLTSHFEIVVVDDASADHTVELVRDLAREYPQVRLICHSEMKGKETAVKTGLQWAQGRTVFVQEDPLAPSHTDLQRLWALREDKNLVMARAARQPGVFQPELLDRLTTWGQSLRKLAGGAAASSIQMIRRDALAETPASASEPKLPSTGEPAAPPLPAPYHSRTDAAHPDQPAMPRFGATFLKHLRDLALGE
jgi:glycosyltransferase involved in cell wall biosynthesis